MTGKRATTTFEGLDHGNDATPRRTDAHDAHGHPTGWRRFVYSTNHKDIGTMYLVFALIGGLIGGVSVDRACGSSCMSPGLQILPRLRTSTTCSSPRTA